MLKFRSALVRIPALLLALTCLALVSSAQQTVSVRPGDNGRTVVVTPTTDTGIAYLPRLTNTVEQWSVSINCSGATYSCRIVPPAPAEINNTGYYLVLPGTTALVKSRGTDFRVVGAEVSNDGSKTTVPGDLQVNNLSALGSVKAGATVVDSLNGNALRKQTWCAVGDSITAGGGASVPGTTDYVALLMGLLGSSTATRYATAGNTLQDVWSGTAVGSTPLESLTSVNCPSSVVLIGQNDFTNGTWSAALASNYASYTQMLEALYVWLGWKNLTLGSAMTASGTWTASDLWSVGVKSSTATDTLTFTAFGSTVGVAAECTLSSTANFTVTIDGVSYGSFTPASYWTPANGGTHGACWYRFANLSRAKHTVVITQNSNGQAVYINFAAGNMGQSYNPIYALTMFDMTGSGIGQATYELGNRLIRNAVSDLRDDGAAIQLVDIQSGCVSTSGTELCNGGTGGHPNDAGHSIIAGLVSGVVQNIGRMPLNGNNFQSGTVATTPTTCVTQNGNVGVATIYTPPSPGLIRLCSVVTVTAAGSAGTFTPLVLATSFGHSYTFSQPVINTTPQWTSNQASTNCTVFRSDAQPVLFGLQATSVAGTPTICYAASVERIQ